MKYIFNKKPIYLDGYLKDQLDKNIIPELKIHDRDVVFCITGRERDGKSTFAQIVGGYIALQLGTSFNDTNICMNPDELRTRIERAQKNEVVIYDEAHRGMGSTRSMSEINRILRDLFIEMGQLNLCVIVVLPSFFLLDKYIAIWRTRGLFHVYTLKRKRGFWVYFNEKEKKRLYLYGKKMLNMDCMRWPKLRGVFGKKTPIDEEKYLEKKRRSFKEREHTPGMEKYLYQRDVLVLMLRRKAKITQKAIAEWLIQWGIPSAKTTIGDIDAKYRKNEGIGTKTEH